MYAKDRIRARFFRDSMRQEIPTMAITFVNGVEYEF